MDTAEPRAPCARLPPMQTLRRLAGPLALVLLVAACTGAAGSSGSPAPSSPPATAAPSPSADPPATVDPNEPVGTDVPPGGGGGGNGPLIVPKPGQLEPRPVRMDELKAAVTGRNLVVTATWTSGVEPCYVLDRIVVEKGADSFTITLLEGRGLGDPICIEIAQTKQTQVDLGEVAPGTYTITDGQGGAPPIEVTVS